MAVQIIPEQGLGESLGAGLAQGLQGLAQLKAQDLMRRQQAQYNVPLLQGLLPGVQGDQLQQLAMADPALLNQLIQQQRQMQRGSMLAGLYGDQRLAGLTPQEIQAYVSSPQYQRQAVRQESQAQAAPIIDNLTRLVKQGVGSNVLTSYLQKKFGLAGADFNALVAQLKAFKDPQLQALAGGLQEAKTDRSRREILASYLQDNPNQIEGLGQILSSVTGNLGQQPQAAQTSPLAAQNMQEAMAELTPAPERTLGQQVTGVIQEGVKSFPKLLERETPQEFAERTAKIERDITSPEYNFLREGIEGLPIGQDILSQGISNVAKSATKTIENIAERISPGSTAEPQGIPEKAARLTFQNLPLLALTGAGTPLGIATDFASSLGLETAKDLGLGTTGQLVSSIGSAMLARKGFGALAKSLGGAKPKTTLGDFKKELYEEAEKAGAKPSIEAQKFGAEAEKGIINKLDNLAAKITEETVSESPKGAFTGKQKENLLENIGTTRTNLFNRLAERSKDEKKFANLLTENDLAVELRNINNNFVRSESTFGNYYSKYRGVIADAIEEAGKKNPEWYKKWKPANELHRIQNWQSPITAALKQFGGTKVIDKIVKNPFFLLAAPGLIGKKAASLIGVNLTSQSIDKAFQGGKILQFAYNNPQGQELLNRLVTASATNDGGAIKSTLLAFDKFLRKNEAAIKRRVGEAATLQPQQA
jgi:hypothetical protein